MFLEPVSNNSGGHVVIEMAMDARRAAKRITVPIRKPRNAADAPFRHNPEGRDDWGASLRYRSSPGHWVCLRRGAFRCIPNRLRRAPVIIRGRFLKGCP